MEANCCMRAWEKPRPVLAKVAKGAQSRSKKRIVDIRRRCHVDCAGNGPCDKSSTVDESGCTG